MSNAEATGLEMDDHPVSRLSGTHDRPDSLDDELKLGASELAAAGARNDEEDQGSEYELLLDPNLPEEYEARHQPHPEEGSEGAEPKPEEEDSPYPEVRAAVRNHDEDVPCNTVRAWTIGLSLVVVGASANTLFSLRQPSISIGPLIAQIISWPLGHCWARFVPDKSITAFGRTVSLNPGPFNIKEHAIIVVMAGVSFSVAYATDIILAQLVFYKQNFGTGFQLLLTISTQSLGYGIAGMMRRFLGKYQLSKKNPSARTADSHQVYPASMIWPGNLAAVTLLNAMHETNEVRDPTILGGSMPRYKWFGIVTACAFVYYFIPGFLVQCLSIFAFVTWMAPRNPVVNQLFGGQTGLSLIPITFDWAQVSGYIGSPLIPPWY